LQRSCDILQFVPDLAVLLCCCCCCCCCSQGTKVSVNDFVMRAAALALRDTPAANAFWDKAAEAAVQQSSVDVCVAVATDGGLITPIVKAADTKTLTQVSKCERCGCSTRFAANTAGGTGGPQ
jgi:hypothetical protein